MNRNRIGAREPGFERHEFNVELRGGFGGGVGVGRNHLHAEPVAARRNNAPNVAEAHHAERAVEELHALEALPLPPAGLQRRGRLRNVARQRDQQRNRVLRRRNAVAFGRVDDHNAAPCGGSDIHIVHADARAPNDAKLPAGRNQFRIGLRAAANHEPRRVRNFAPQLFGRALQRLNQFQLRRFFKNGEPLGRERVGDEYFGHGLSFR